MSTSVGRVAKQASAWAVLLGYLACVAAGSSAQQVSSPQHDQKPPDRRFLAALAAYRAQQYETAQKQLVPLVQSAPQNFEYNELLGLVYVAEGRHEQANPLLAKAVRLKPDELEARTELATNLMALHRTDEAEVQFKKAAALQPAGYDVNHNLGEFYIQAGKIADAVPYLKRAQEADPSAYNNGYDLALALEQVGKLDDARTQLEALIAKHESAELHSLLGEVEEKSRNYVASAAQYEQAARMDPSEQNILNWGAELILHQTFTAAIEVFRAGTERFPQAAQLQNGLGIALYGAGQTDDAVRAFLRAADMVPSDPLPLTFMGKACDGASPAIADQIRSRLQSFINRDSQKADLDYYLATCLWRTNQAQLTPGLNSRVEALLKHASMLDPHYADAYLELGNVYSDQHKYPEAIEAYEQAIKIDPNAANAHYRLGQALARSGNEARAQAELATFERLRKSESDEKQKEQSQIQQFVYTIRKADAN
jgi:tetratricopeptide (TPR) repeat protein